VEAAGLPCQHQSPVGFKKRPKTSLLLSPFLLEYPKRIHSHRKIPIYRHGQIWRLSAGLGLRRKFEFPPSANVNGCHEVARIDLLISG
jgi:hypothetical protein